MSHAQFIVIPPLNLTVSITDILAVLPLKERSGESNGRQGFYMCFEIVLRSQYQANIICNLDSNYLYGYNSDEAKRIKIMSYHILTKIRENLINSLPSLKRIDMPDIFLDPTTMSPEQYTTWLEQATMAKLEQFSDTGIIQT
jgi:hypothetical protein